MTPFEWAYLLIVAVALVVDISDKWWRGKKK